ncbi:MAG: hypothetical protein Rubg2KO_02840 [Rubricoccaceae bacterium]
MRFFLRPLAFLLLGLAISASAQPAVEAPLNRVLNAVVGTDGLVDYALLKRSHVADLDAALDAIATTDPATLRSNAQKTAFLLNAYNAHVLKRVLESPRARNLERQNLFGAFFETPVQVAGQRLTLNQIEHGILRRQNRVDGASVPSSARALRPRQLDPRIHAGLNCAAVSCPPLVREAFTATRVSGQLDRAWRAFLGSSRAARVEGNRVVVSSIFDWFASDFERGDQRVGDRIARASASSAIQRALRGKTAADLRRAGDVRFAYDWTVNRR